MEPAVSDNHPNMVMFRGKMTCSPNTLNNQIHTYFFADYWQRQYTRLQFKRKKELKDIKMAKLRKEKYDPAQEIILSQKCQYTYDKWMELVQGVAQFNRFYVQCFKEAFPGKGDNINIMDFRAFRLFHDWDVWGDSTSYPEIKATAVFDPNKDQPSKDKPDKDWPFSTLSNDLHLSTKMGTNKCVIANMDTDSQDMSKLFAFTLNMNSQIKIHLNPSVCRTLYIRTVDTLPWTTSMGVHWFGGGKIELLPSNKDKTVDYPLDKLYDEGTKKSLTELRMLQYRYNHPTKVSNIVGYLMNTQDDPQNSYQYINHNWRMVKVASNEYYNPNPIRNYNGSTNNHTSAQVFFRNVEYGKDKKGVLIDLSAAVMDGDNQEGLPYFPNSLHLLIKPPGASQDKSYVDQKIEDADLIKDLFHNKAGLFLAHDKTIPSQPVEISLHEIIRSTVVEQALINVQFNGKESDYNLEIKDHFLKTKPMRLLKGGLDDTSKKAILYENFVEFQLNCTQYGGKVSGQFDVSLYSEFNIDSSGITQYTTHPDYLKKKGIDPPLDRLNELISKSDKFKEVFPDTDAVDRLVFQGKLSKIIELTDLYMNKLFWDEKLQYYFQEKDQEKIKKYGQRRIFRLSFSPSDEIFQTKVSFVNGIGRVKVYLNTTLTKFNNPRHPAMQSLCMTGQLKIGCIDVKNEFAANFTALYFQNPDKYPYDKIDWLNTIGPKLKLMGLMYPSMQNIINLYDYDGLSMNAMRRAFEIEDQNHSRYMPATREMSPTTHRQIRRWLYSPVYDARINIDTIAPDKSFNSFPFQDFEEGLKALKKLLKGAFKLQLTTIPIYLSAMYSITKEGQATSLIRSVAKDEMKHLFIVSNLINAIGDTPPYPKPSQQGIADENIPTFPVKTKDDLICFHFQVEDNKPWQDFMGEIPIQSSIVEQLLRFIMIEMPGEAYEIKITNHALNPEGDLYEPIRRCKCSKIFCPCERNVEEERNYRIDLIQRAIHAVVLELIHKDQQTIHPISSAGQPPEFLTIGMAYDKITNYLWELNDISSENLFTGNNGKQFTYMYLDSMTEIINLRTALQQIRLITLEGEGSSMYTVTGQTNKTSHFIKFIEIFTGCDLEILSGYTTTSQGIDSKGSMKRQANFIFTPNPKRFPNFPNYTDVVWSKEVDQQVDQKVNSQLTLERLSDNLRHTQFPNTYAPRSFLNSYVKILEELGFIFNSDPNTFVPEKGETFEQARLKSMENTIAKMRQMSLNATHIVHPNDTFDRLPHPTGQKPKYPPSSIPPSEFYPSASPKYNIQESKWIPQ